MNFNLFEGGRRVAKAISYMLIAFSVFMMLIGWKRLGITPIIELAVELSLLWVFTKAVGWIVRGLFGIPNGMDYRITRMDGSRVDERCL